jgi:threonine/homoserine/homoserine lactone efflux protein
MTDPLAFCLAVLAVLATPGPTNTLLSISGASAGFRHSLALVPAELAGYLTTILTVSIVVGALLSQRPIFAVALRLGIAAYLIVLATRLWRGRKHSAEMRRSVTARDVLVTTILNPKALLFAFVIIPMHRLNWIQYLMAFSALAVCMSFAWIAVGVAIRRGVMTPSQQRLIPSVGAIVILFFAAVAVWPLVRTLPA